MIHHFQSHHLYMTVKNSSANDSSFHSKEGQQTPKPTLTDEKNFAMETPQQHKAALEYSAEKQKRLKLSS